MCEPDDHWFDDCHADTLLHRVEGPAVMRVHGPSGTVVKEEWYQQGRLHRVDGPAVVLRTALGRVYTMQWWVDGKEHPQQWPDLVAVPQRRAVVACRVDG